MPSAEMDRKLKRKRSAIKEPNQKRIKSESSDDESVQDHILLLESAILQSKKNYNNITTLQQIAQNYRDSDEAAIIAAVSLCRVFVRLLAAGSLANKKGLSEKDVVVVQWLKDRLGGYKQTLLEMLEQNEWAGTALTLCLRLLKAEGEHLSDREDYSFPKTYLASIVNVILYSDIDDSIRNEYAKKYMTEYNDIRLYTFKAIKAILMDGSQVPDTEALFSNAMKILSATNNIPNDKERPKSFYLPPPQKKNHAVRSVPQLKKNAQEAWLALMRLATAKDQRKQLLSVMTSDIAPWFTQPELLSDFLTDCYNTGGSVSLLALSGVFYLIQERNLDYPSFYAKLYSLLDGNIFHSKHRSNFFRLLDTFLASTHLPAALIASFIKRLSRLSLFAPPGAIVVVVPFLYNLFKRHPQTTFMMHRTLDHVPELKAEVEREGFKDPFDPDETDPMETCAIDSCIWEIVQLQSHYHPNVATIAKIVSEQFTKQQYNMEDFLDHSYQSLLDAEFDKEVKKPPVVEFVIPKHIFMPHREDSPPEAEDSLLVKLIDFS